MRSLPKLCAWLHLGHLAKAMVVFCLMMIVAVSLCFADPGSGEGDDGNQTDTPPVCEPDGDDGLGDDDKNEPGQDEECDPDCCPDDDPDCCDEDDDDDDTTDPGSTKDPGEPGQGAPCAAGSSMMMSLHKGAAVVNTTHLHGYCPGPDFFHNASYNSSLAQTGGGGLMESSDGARWFGGSQGPYLRSGSGSAVELYVDASTKRVFDSSLDAPADYDATLEKSGTNEDEIYTLTHNDTGDIFIFYGLNSSVKTEHPGHAGRLKERTNREFVAQTPPVSGIEYTYNSDGTVNQVTLPQGWTVDYDYHTTGDESGRVKLIEVNDDTLAVVEKVEYTYFGEATSPHNDIGDTGDLVQVKQSKLASDGSTWTERYTQYRYYRSSSSDGAAHQLKMVLEPDDVDRISSESGFTPAQIMQKPDNEDVATGTEIQDYASRTITYYTSNLNTGNAVSTPWSGAGTENLQNKYGGADLDEVENGDGRVKTQKISGACGGCGSGATGGGLKHTFFYIKLNGGSSSDVNEVVQIVVQDTEDADDGEVSRRLYGLNDYGIKLRHALIEDPDASTLMAWCRSIKLDSSSPSNRRVVEKRMASAHTAVTDNETMQNFLDPTSGSNDASTLDNSTGAIYVYEYDDNDYRQAKKVKKGENGTAYYMWYRIFGDSANEDEQEYLPKEFRTYHVATSNKDSNKIVTTYSYVFHDDEDTHLQKVMTTPPKVIPGQNGSDETTTVEAHYDTFGQLRWTVDGEGYVNYYSYHPELGTLAYVVADADPGGLPSDEDDHPTKWNPSSHGAASSNKPTRDSSLPAELAYVWRQEYDTRGRPTLTKLPDDTEHYTVYEEDLTLEFPYWDSGTDKPLLPIRAIQTNGGGQITDVYTIDPDRTAVTSGKPTGLSSGTGQSHYISWAVFDYHDTSGEIVAIDRYHDIPSGGPVSHSTHFHRTGYIYDEQGRQAYVIQQVSGAPNSSGSGVEQLTQRVFDVRNRIVEVRRGVSDSDHDLGTGADNYDNYTGVTLKPVLKREYDNDDVGDGHVTQVTQYHDTGTNDYTGHKLHRTHRGHLRGIEPFYRNGSSDTEIGPFTVQDVDWKGRQTAVARYTTEPNWASSVIDDDDYAATTSTSRVKYHETSYDDLGRVYRTKEYAVASGTAGNAIQNDYYYDFNGRVVASQPKYSAGTEYAYDGIGRRYQTRILIDLAATKYSSGAFQYRAPTPKTTVTSMSGGDEDVIAFRHLAFDKSSNVTESHLFELNHDDTDGLTLTGTADYVRSSIFRWYDEANRLSEIGNYGSGDGTTASDYGEWKKTTVPSPSSAPTVSSYSVLLTKFEYHDGDANDDDNDSSGRLLSVTDPEGTVTRYLYDAVGRRTYVVGNYTDFESPSTNTGGSDKSQDQVVKRVYNGLDRITTLTAMDADANPNTSDNQDTSYEYTDDYNASLATKATYPDSQDSDDVVTMSYFLDGLLKSRTDQRGVIMDYTYKPYPSRRTLEWEKATTIPSSVDNTVQSIKREFDTQRRIDKITSYGDTTGTTAKNQIDYTYHTNVPGDRVEYSYQDHDGTVTTGSTGSPRIHYRWDDEDTGGIFSNGPRMDRIRYPTDDHAVFLNYDDNNDDDGISDALHRLYRPRGNHTGTYKDIAKYKYNGIGRLVKTEYPTPQVFCDYFDGNDADGIYEHLDRFGRVETQKWLKSSTVKDQFVYTHDHVGNRLTRDIDSTLTDNHDQIFTYDGLHRLADVKEGELNGGTITGDDLKFAQEWTLDALGNWTNFKQDDDGNGWDLDQDREHNSVNEIDNDDDHETAPVNAITGSPNWVDPEHDEAGNMTKIPQPASPTSSHTLKWDAWNRLIQVDDGNVATYEYDGLHRRIVKDTGTDEFHYYYNENWQVLEVRLDDGTTVEEYFWHPYYVDALAARYYDENGDGDYTDADETEFALHDANFNVTSLVNTSSTVIERYTYSPYGEVTFRDGSFGERSGGSDFANPYTYTGRRFDDETEFYYYRNRYYHAQLGRFISRDPISYYGSEWNLYEYLGSEPNSGVDPLGLTEPMPSDAFFWIFDLLPQGRVAKRCVTRGIDKIGREYVERKLKKEAAEKVAREAKEKAAKEAAEKAAKGKVKPGDEGTYGQLKKQKAKHGETEPLDMDHQPSFAAQVKAKENALGRNLTKKELAQLKKDTPAVASPRDVHQKTSPTYGGKNTSKRIEEDAVDLDSARARDRAAFDEAMQKRSRGQP